MPASQFLRFRLEVLKMGEREAAIRLGMSRGFLRTCEQEGAPLYVAYACAAIANNLKPYGWRQWQVPIRWNDDARAWDTER